MARERPQRGFAAIGQYGTSLSQLIVVPLPADLATSLLANIEKAGSAGRDVPVDPPPAARGQAASAQAGALVSPLLQLAVVRVGDRAWAVGGLVPDAVLDRAVSDLAGSVA